jgi:hypothetical protein
MTSANRLHNMSAPPRTVLRHAPGEGFLLGVYLVLRAPVLPAHAEGLLALLDGERWEGDGEGELRRRLNEHARRLPFPAIVPITDQCGEEHYVRHDLLDVFTVLAKSSAHVYLRDKEPNLAAIRSERRVVLLLPPDWRLA